MKKLQQSFESEAQTFQKKLTNYQEKFQGKFQGMIQKSEEKKEKIIQKLQSTKEQLQLSIEKNNTNKKSKLYNKIQNLQAELQKINRKDQIAKDYHLVYDGLIQQLQITQDQKIGALSQSQRNENFQILCSIKRQAINLQSQVQKKKHTDPLIQICHNCNNLLNEYLKFGVDIQFQQADIFQIDIDANNKLRERLKEQDERNFFKYQKDQQFQSQYNMNDSKNSQRNKPNYYEEKQFKQYIQEPEHENKQPGEQERYQKLWNKKSYNQPNQPQEYKQPQDMVNQFDNLKIEDKKQENIQQQQQQQTKLDESNLCQICFEFPKQYVASPCGHFIYCHNCKELALKQCLICREPVQLLIKVFQ